jgi:hypothetical protein
MRIRITAVLFGCFIFAATGQADSPIAIQLSREYGKKWDVEIDGKKTPGTKVLDELINAKQAKGGSGSVIVLLPSSVSLSGWSNIQGIVDKVGFSDSRYFALSDNGDKMIEIKRVGSAVPVSSAP